jgi:hypothetical protein
MFASLVVGFAVGTALYAYNHISVNAIIDKLAQKILPFQKKDEPET